MALVMPAKLRDFFSYFVAILHVMSCQKMRGTFWTPSPRLILGYAPEVEMHEHTALVILGGRRNDIRIKVKRRDEVSVWTRRRDSCTFAVAVRQFDLVAAATTAENQG